MFFKLNAEKDLVYKKLKPVVLNLESPAISLIAINPKETFLRIQDVCLYTAQDDTITEGYHIKNYLANNNIEFQHLHYETPHHYTN